MCQTGRQMHCCTRAEREREKRKTFITARFCLEYCSTEGNVGVKQLFKCLYHSAIQYLHICFSSFTASHRKCEILSTEQIFGAESCVVFRFEGTLPMHGCCTVVLLAAISEIGCTHNTLVTAGSQHSLTSELSVQYNGQVREQFYFYFLL